VDATGCPRCVAERRAWWVRGAIYVGAGAAVLALLAVFYLVGVESFAFDHNVGTLLPLAVVLAECASRLFALALAVPCIVLGLCVFLRILTRRASTPLPPPPADPLATYRDGPPAECPRHPFAR
jgi:hypothetical protein